MTDKDWEHIDYFSRDEAWGDPNKMDLLFVRELSKFRDFIKRPVIVTCGTQGSHAVESHHADGVAIDCVIPGRNLLDSWIDGCRFGFTGIGFYPRWQYQGKTIGGLHLEMVAGQTPRKFWMGIGNQHFDTQYVTMSEDNLRVFYLFLHKN